MTEFTPENIILNDSPATTRRRFPVLAQLGILGLLLGMLFFAVILPNRAPETPVALLGAAEPRETATASVAITPITDINVTADAVFVYDVRTNRVLFSKNPDKVLPLASITKLMTSLVTTELIPNETTVRVPKQAIAQDGASGLADGETLTAEALRNYAMLASSNDAAYALSAAVGSELSDSNPEWAFIETMNIRAEELGLSSLSFKNATGLDISTTEAGAYGSARDVSFLMAYILENNPEILYTTTAEKEVIDSKDGTYHQAENTNPIITSIPNLLGSKTGYTDLAGGNLTIAYDIGFDRPVIITVLGSTYSDRFTDTQRIIKAITAATNTSTE